MPNFIIPDAYRTQKPTPTPTSLFAAAGIQAAQAARESVSEEIRRRQSMTPEEYAYYQQERKSEDFYENIGYPQYGGIYQAFEIPEGYQVHEVKETATGLSIAFIRTPIPEQTTLQPSPSRGELPPAPKGTLQVDVPKFMSKAFLGETVIEKTQRQMEETAAFKKDPLGYTTGKVLTTVGLVSALINPPAAIAAGLVGSTITEGLSYGLTGRHLEPKEFIQAGVQSAGFGMIAGGTFRAVSVIPKYGTAIVSHGLGRAVISGGLGAGMGYGASGGDIGKAGEGFLFGFGLSIGTEYVLTPIVQEIRAKLPSRFPFSTKRLTVGEPVMGKGGKPVETYYSDPLAELQGRRLQVVADVTRDPAGITELQRAYQGKQITTAHATLAGDVFSTGKGGTTLLKGVAGESAGFRKAQQLYPFYSAPSDLSDEFVSIYGGYMGVGEGYSGTPRIRFGGRSTVIMTTETIISPKYIPEVAGLTSIPVENVLGISTERQVATTTAYQRFGKELAGTVFKSQGKLGSFQIKQLPQGTVGKIPILRTLLSKYTTFDVTLGEFLPAAAATPVAKTVEMKPYSKGYGKTTTVSKAAVSLPSAIVAGVAAKTTRKTAVKKAAASKISKAVSVLSSPSPILSSRTSRVSKPSRSRGSSASRSTGSSGSSGRSKPSGSSVISSPSSSPSVSSIILSRRDGKLPKRKKKVKPQEAWLKQQRRMIPLSTLDVVTGLPETAAASRAANIILGKRTKRRVRRKVRK